MNLLSKLLDKRGIKNETDLSHEEKATFERYKVILGGETVTVDSLKEFCKAQIKILESKCDGVTPLSMVQQASIHVYVTLLKAIEAPEAERRALEEQLNQLIKQ